MKNGIQKTEISLKDASIKIFSKSNLLNYVVFFITLLTFIIFFISYINNQITLKINDRDYIEKLAYSFRPFLIFDSKGVIQYDHGASQLLDSVKVNIDPNRELTSIIIKTKNFYQKEPLIECLGPNRYYFESERMSNNKYKYSVKYTGDILKDDSIEIIETFRLEFLK